MTLHDIRGQRHTVSMKTDRLTIRLDPEIAVEVQRLAATEHLTKAAVVSRALWAALKPGGTITLPVNPTISMTGADSAAPFDFGAEFEKLAHVDPDLTEEERTVRGRPFKVKASPDPVQDAKPDTRQAEGQGEPIGRTGGAHPPTGVKPQHDLAEQVRVFGADSLLPENFRVTDAEREHRRKLLTGAVQPKKVKS